MIQANAEYIRQIVQAALERPEQTGALIGTVIAIAVNYSKTGSIPLGRLPYKHIRQGIRELREAYFGRSRPKGVPALLLTNTDLAELEDQMRPRHYEDGSMFSKDYDSEVLNMRRPRGTVLNPETGDPVPMETHFRAFETSMGDLLVICHDEAHRFEATGEHLDAGLYSWDRGRDILQEDLDAVGMAYDKIESERSADITVVAN